MFFIKIIIIYRYFSRNLVKFVDDNFFVIMFLFEFKGRLEDEDNDFYI